MFNIKTTLVGDMTNLNDQVTTQQIVIATDKIQNMKISNDLYLSFPHLYAEILLDNVTMKVRYIKVEIEDSVTLFKREWIFSVYMFLTAENQTEMGTNTVSYIIKGLSIPVQHLNTKFTKTYDKSSTEVIVDLFKGQDTNYNIDVKTQLNTSSLRWNRVNMNDLQFFNFLKEYTQLINDYTIIPMFFLKDKFKDNKITRELHLNNLVSVEQKDVSFKVDFKKILFTSETYLFNIVDTDRRNYVHTTNPYFKTIGGKNRKSSTNFDEAILTEFINSPNVVINSTANDKYGLLYRNSSTIMIPKITDSYYLELVEMGNVFCIENYNNTNSDGTETKDVDYFNVIGYELEIIGKEANSILRSKLITSKI